MRRIISAVMIALLLSSWISIGFAHEKQEQHDEDLWKVLFGNESFPNLSSQKDNYDSLSEKQALFYTLTDAAAICIDQFSSNEEQEAKKDNVFKRLSSRIRLSYSFDEIDLNKGNVDGESVHVRNHRSFTHQGWNYKYAHLDFWQKRKQILIDAVKQSVFSKSDTFWRLPWESTNYSDEQVDAFCALIYYVHILGDHMEGKTDEQVGELLPISRRDLIRSPGIIPELLEYLEVLFPSQCYSYSFLYLQSEMESLATQAERNYYNGTTGIHTQAEIDENNRIAQDLLNLLASKIPDMLKNETFFQNVFSD